MDSSKKIYILIGVLIVAVLILILAMFFGRGGFSPTEEEKLPVSLCPERVTYQEDVYNAVEIGKQCWLAENLKTSAFRDGTPIPSLTVSAEWAEDDQGAFACYYNLPQNCEEYGALYNWYAVNNQAGLCPEGWSVPSQEQWAELERTICQDLGYQDCSERFPFEFVSGWQGSDEDLHLRSIDSGGKDTFGFKALFAGFRNAAGPYDFSEERGFFWTATASGDFAYVRVMDKDNQGIRRAESSKSSGFSVRCVMD